LHVKVLSFNKIRNLVQIEKVGHMWSNLWELGLHGTFDCTGVHSDDSDQMCGHKN